MRAGSHSVLTFAKMCPMDWRRLGEMVKARRVEVGMVRQQDLAEATGLTRRVLTDVENGRRDNYDTTTLARLERALRWRPGSVQSILSGGEPRAMLETELADLSLDPRPLERYGDDQELLQILSEANLTLGDRLKVVVHLRDRRAEQHADLVRELRQMLGLPDDGDGPAG